MPPVPHRSGPCRDGGGSQDGTFLHALRAFVTLARGATGGGTNDCGQLVLCF
jgi:hypothetical protein